jgi:orotidine-5'-phosphate decarboxylase
MRRAGQCNTCAHGFSALCSAIRAALFFRHREMRFSWSRRKWSGAVWYGGCTFHGVLHERVLPDLNPGEPSCALGAKIIILQEYMTFLEALASAQQETDSLLCVGLDPDPALLPHHLQNAPVGPAVAEFCREIIEATAAVACAYKPNLAFFEALGPDGFRILHDVVRRIPEGRVVIADGKRGDIGNTARLYAKAVFEELGCTACTVSPYMGRDSVEPFLEFAGKGVFVLARTSNAGASDFQEKIVGGAPLYVHVARRVREWGRGKPGTAGLVVGATAPGGLALLRLEAPDLPFLVPGVGAQGGEAEVVVREAGSGGAPILVNSSRQILYASAGRDFAAAAEQEARLLRDTLNRARRSAAAG